MKLAKILPITALRLGPTQFLAEVERLQREGRMPTLREALGSLKAPPLLRQRKPYLTGSPPSRRGRRCRPDVE